MGLALLLFLGAAQTASAAMIEVTSLVGLGANDLVDWSLHGPAIGSNPFTASSNAGVSVTTSEPSSVFVTTEQSPPGGWFGHFPAGTTLIYDQGPNGPVTFAFATPIEGFGMTLDISQNGSFTETIQGFNGNTSLGMFTTAPGTGLLFLGILDTTADITSITVSTAAATNNAFAFGNLSLVEPVQSSATPEPGSLGAVALGLGCLALSGQRRLGAWSRR